MRIRLREIRELKGYTQEEIAKEAGISRSSYTNIELGRKNPSLQVALKIKKILDHEEDDIFLPLKVPKGNKKANKQLKSN